MIRILSKLILLTLVLAAFAAGPASAMPMAWLQVGNGPTQTLSDWVQFQDGWFLNFSVQTSQYTVSGNVATVGDPYMSYGVAFNNNSGVALPVSFGIYDVVAPIASPTTIYSSFSGSGTDVMGDGFSMTPTSPDLDGDGLMEIQTTMLNGTTSAGVDVGLGHTFGPGVPGHSNNLGTYSSGPMAGPAGGPWTSFGTNLNFNLSKDDIATVNGYASIGVAPVPEPASLMLLGLGLVGTAIVARRKRS